MSVRSRRGDSGLPRRGSNSGPLYVAFAIISLAAIGLAYLALSGVSLGNRPTTAPIPDTTPNIMLVPTATPTAPPGFAATAVGLVGGDSSGWWAASVETGLLPGISAGEQVGKVGDDIATLTAQLGGASISQGQPIVVQVGSQDIVEGASAAEIDESTRTLWQEIRARGGQPIAVLIPPSNAYPGSVVAVNNQIRTSAGAEGIAVLDLTTSVATVDGTWSAGFSDDGQQPSASGLAAIVDAVRSQLPELIGLTSAAG